MNIEKVDAIINSAKQSFRDSNFTESEVTTGISILSYLLELFNKPYISTNRGELHVILWPVDDSKFVEVLRVYANILEIKINERDK